MEVMQARYNKGGRGGIKKGKKRKEKEAEKVKAFGMRTRAGGRAENDDEIIMKKRLRSKGGRG